MCWVKLTTVRGQVGVVRLGTWGKGVRREKELCRMLITSVEGTKVVNFAKQWPRFIEWRKHSILVTSNIFPFHLQAGAVCDCRRQNSTCLSTSLHFLIWHIPPELRRSWSSTDSFSLLPGLYHVFFLNNFTLREAIKPLRRNGSPSVKMYAKKERKQKILLKEE